MRAVERTTRAFVASVTAALPGVHIWVDRSVSRAGRSNYVFIDMPDRREKVRISDHAVGMRRAMWGEETLLLHAGATIDHWSVWLSQIARRIPMQGRRELFDA
jgi:hypothetical protein